MRIPQGTYDAAAVSPAWLPVTAKGKEIKPIIRCACGMLTSIRLHHVHPDGRVTASFLHPLDGGPNSTPGCGFHEMLELDNWTGSEFPAQP